MNLQIKNCLMDVILVTGEKVSKNSRPSSCLKPFATSLALYFSIEPSGFNFFLKTHLQQIVLQLGGKSTNFQVLLEIRDSISSFIFNCNIAILLSSTFFH